MSRQVPDVFEADLHDIGESRASKLKLTKVIHQSANQKWLIYSKYAKEGSVMWKNLEHCSFNQREWSRKIVRDKHCSFLSDLCEVLTNSTDDQERIRLELNFCKL